MIREIFRVVNFVLAIGLIVPVYRLLKDIFNIIKRQEDNSGGKIFLVIYGSTIVIVLVSSVFYAVGTLGLVNLEVLHEVSSIRSTLNLTAFWIQTIAFYLARRNKL